MSDTLEAAAMPRGLPTDMPTASLEAGLALLSRRSTAISEFWRSCAEVRQPAELMAVQLHYWTQLVEDYQGAFAAGMSQMLNPAESATLSSEPLQRRA